MTEKTEVLLNNSASVFKDKILAHLTMDELLALISCGVERVEFRTAWFVEHIIMDRDKQYLSQHITPLLNIYYSTNNWSALRCITKCIMKYLSHTDTNDISENTAEQILNKTYNILEHPECPIAIRCNCYDIIYPFVAKYEWLSHDLKLKLQLDAEMYDTPAIRSRSKALLKKLK